MLSPEQRQIVATVRDVTQTTIKPNGRRYLDGTFPWHNLEALARIGVLGMAVPEAYGGTELSVLDTALVLEEIAKACYVTAMAVLGEVGVQTRIIANFAPEAIKSDVLPRVAAGEALLAICMTEPEAGTDVASYRTNAEVGSSAVRLNGVKTLISRADEAAMFVVFTRVDQRPGGGGIGCILVPRDTPGFSVTANYQTMGGELLHEVRFENCELPQDHLIIRENGMRTLLSAFNVQRCLNPAISLGLAEGGFEESVRYVRERQAFGHPIADFQGVRWKLADMYREIETARTILYRACRTADPFPDPLLAAVAKVACNEMAIRVTSEAVQLHGGYGFTDEFLVSRLYRGARYGTLGGGTSETLRDLIGKRVIGHYDERAGTAGLAADLGV